MRLQYAGERTETENPRVPLAERLTFASIYQSNLDEFYMVRVGTLMDQMQASEEIRDNKTNMTREEQVDAILKETRELDLKEEGELLEAYFSHEIAPYLSVNIVGKGQPFPFLKNKDIYAAALLKNSSGRSRTAIIPCSNNVFRRLIEIPTRPGTYMLSEELILHFIPNLFDKYTIMEKSLLRITRNADIDTETIFDEDLDYREAMENLIRQRKRMNPVQMELSRELNKKLVTELCRCIGLEKNHVFLSAVPLDLSFVFGIQNYLRSKNREELFYQKRSPRAAASQDEKAGLLAQVEKKDVLLKYPFENIKTFINFLHEAAKDESVVSIKMTLYRLADKSQIVDAMVIVVCIVIFKIKKIL